MTESYEDPKDIPEASKRVTRRQAMLMITTGVIGAAVGATSGMFAAPPRVVEKIVEKEVPVKPPPIPTTPIKIGLQTFFKGPNTPLGVPLHQGCLLAAEEINAKGGILGKRKIEIIARDEAGVDETVKEYKRLVLEDKIDYYIGLVSSANTPAVAPHAEELGVITLFIDGCTDTVFDVVDPHPKFVFRNHLQSPDGISLALQAIRVARQRGIKIKKIAHMHPDYAYGRLVHAHSDLVMHTIIPEVETVYESFVKFPGTTDFSAYITRMIELAPDIVLSSEWGGDFLAFYKQALGYGFFAKMPLFGCTLSHGCYPEFVTTDFPDGHLAGVHANYWYEYPEWDKWPVNKSFATAFKARWGGYPNFEAEGAYVMLYALRGAIEEVATKIKGAWPGVDDIIPVLENWAAFGPAGYFQIRKDNHEGYKNATIGISKADPTLGFSKLVDPYVIPFQYICAPPGWQHTEFDPKGKLPTATADWVTKTWKKGEWPRGVPS